MNIHRTIQLLAIAILLVSPQFATAQILTGGAPNPTFDAGAAGNDLQLWLRADAGVGFGSGTSVMTWADQSTYGRNASQAVVGQQPMFAPSTLGGQPTLQFTNAASSALDLGANSFSGHQTTFVVYNDISTAAYTTPIGTAYTGRGTYHGNNNDGAIFNATYTDPSTLNGSNYVGGKIVGNGTSTPRPDSFTINTYRAAGAYPAAQTISRIGADTCCGVGLVGRSINGGIAEVLVYDRQLTGAEIDQVGNYLGSKYSLAWNNVSTTTPDNALTLADIVTGGDGTGTPNTANGINKATGAITTGNVNFVTGTGFQSVGALNFVDGVGVPDGGAGPVQYNSLGGTIAGLSDTNNQSWDYVLADPSNAGSSVLNGVEYNNVDGHTMIDIHANTLLTFDLDAIEAFHGGEVGRFTGVVGLPNTAGGDDVRFEVYLDGILAETLDIDSTDRGTGFDLDIPIAASDQFLTLIALDLNNTISFDQVIIGDARLLLVPEPRSAAIWMVGLFALLGWIATARLHGVRESRA